MFLAIIFMLSKQKLEDRDQKYPISYHLLKEGVEGFPFNFFIYFAFVLLWIKAHKGSFTIIPCC